MPRAARLRNPGGLGNGPGSSASASSVTGSTGSTGSTRERSPVRRAARRAMAVAALLLAAKSGLAAPSRSRGAEASTALPARLALPAPRPLRWREGLPPQGEYFVDTDGATRLFHPVQRAWFAEYGREPHYDLIFAEIGVVLGVQSLNYWARPWVNVQDWDDPKLSDRVNFHAVRFDNNLAFTNFVLHPLAGGGYYWASRVNDATASEAMLYSALASAFWEFALEWREQVSVNDLIVTPAGGIPLGAFAFRLSDYLASARPGTSVATDAGAYTFGLPRKFHSLEPDPRQGVGRLPPDSLGFSSAFWHRFQLGYERSAMVVDGEPSARMNTLTADAELVAMVGFLRPGHFHRFFAGDNFTEMHLRMTFGNDDNEARFGGTLVGLYSQDFDVARHGTRGHAELIGLSNGMRYVEHNYAPASDMYSATQLVGVSLGSWLASGALAARFLGDAHYDFAGVQPLALQDYRRAHPGETLKSVLEIQGYEYSMGPSARLRAEASAYGVTLSGYGDYARYVTVNGIDRTQGQFSREVNASDVIFEYGAALGAQLPWVPVYLRTSFDGVWRHSDFGEYYVVRNDRRFAVGAGLGF